MKKARSRRSPVSCVIRNECARPGDRVRKARRGGVAKLKDEIPNLMGNTPARSTGTCETGGYVSQYLLGLACQLLRDRSRRPASPPASCKGRPGGLSLPRGSGERLEEASWPPYPLVENFAGADSPLDQESQSLRSRRAAVRRDLLMASGPFAVRNEWKLYAHPAFGDPFEKLSAALNDLKRQDPMRTPLIRRPTGDGQSFSDVFVCLSASAALTRR